MRHRANHIAAFVTVWLLVGCTGRYYKTQDIVVDPSRYEILGEGQASVTGVHLFGLIPIGLNDKIERAIAKAVSQQSGGEQLVNATIRESWFWAYVLNGYQLNVQGTVIKAK